MFERIARGWALMRESGQVLRLDKELMLFPIFSSIACLLVMASFALPLVVSPTVRDAVFSAAHLNSTSNARPSKIPPKIPTLAIARNSRLLS